MDNKFTELIKQWLWNSGQCNPEITKQQLIQYGNLGSDCRGV